MKRQQKIVAIPLAAPWGLEFPQLLVSIFTTERLRW